MRFSLLPAKPAPDSPQDLSLDFVDRNKQHVLVNFPDLLIRDFLQESSRSNHGIEVSPELDEGEHAVRTAFSAEDIEFFGLLTSSLKRAMKFAYQQGRDDAMREAKKKEEAEDGVAFHDTTPKFDCGYITLPSRVVNACNANAKDLLAEAAEKIYQDFHANEPGQQRQTT